MSAPKTTLQTAIDLLRQLINSYTRHHSALRIEGKELGELHVIAIQAHRDDHPKIVGTRGAHITALNTIVAAMGRRAGAEFRLRLLEPVTGESGPPLEFCENPEWKPDGVAWLLSHVITATAQGGARVVPESVLGMTTLLVYPGSMEDRAARWENGEIGRALHLLFHAIGKTQGHTLDVAVMDPATNRPINGSAVR